MVTSPATGVSRGSDSPDGARTLYAYASDPEGRFPPGNFVTELRHELDRVARLSPAPEGLDAGERQAAAWSAEEARRYRVLYDSAPGDARQVLVDRAVLACAPLALVSGAWLQWLSDPGNADSAHALRVLTLYAGDVGVGHPRASRGSAYGELLRRLELCDHAVPVTRLALERRVKDRDFRLPALLLAASRHPDEFREEILGADLCLRSVGLLPALGFVRDVLGGGTDWSAVDPSTARREKQSARSLCRDAAEALIAEKGPGAEDRIGRGFSWALATVRRWSEALHEELTASLDPAHDMRELLRRRARAAGVYHRRFELEGRPLSDWLRECRTDPGPLLDVLATSRLVRPGKPQSSPLVNALVGENGPMFRVFSPEDLAVVRRWIASLPAAPGGGAKPPRQDVESPCPSPPGTGPEGTAPSGLREAYHQLQSRDGTEALRRFAAGYVRRRLGRSRQGIDRCALPLPDRWADEGLRPWLLEQHDRHSAEFEESTDFPLPSREELIDSTVQLAPLTLIDGSWLRGFTDYEYASSDVGHFLFETYWDELGNGEMKLNHPLIYREILDQMDVRVPLTGTREFSEWPGFRNSSFELPVYWLSIGRFPRSFQPEILGLNLAMELSGVGGSYRRGHIALKAHGFSTRFVDIHNTIDNVETGHSAWAADAVDAYMSTLPRSGPDDVRRKAWDRIRTGYRSLNPPSGILAHWSGRLRRYS
ncbi:iron-containing redox enzyme family protein [Streptomyces sp. NPDC048297]|uniref:iron-containing redox enzyme family protein n=1 Tax=Streptomyces sp. NPDC048297 TaxID=3365531 RepID=UPI00371AC3E1